MKQRDGSEASRPVALVTGGSTGIGAACVRAFLIAGWRVSVLALPDSDMEWLSSLDDVSLTPGDITYDTVRQASVEQTLSSFGRIDVLINNAGVGLYARATEVSPQLFTRLLDVNVVAPLALAQLVVPIMREQGAGTIVTMGSVAARVCLPWAAAYSASKSALDSLHDALRLELRGSPIHLLRVFPGIIDTEFRDHVLAGAAPESVRGIQYIVSPTKLAKEILRAIQGRKKTLYVPAIGRLFSMLGYLTPALMDHYLLRLMPQQEPARESPRRNAARLKPDGD